MKWIMSAFIILVMGAGMSQAEGPPPDEIRAAMNEYATTDMHLKGGEFLIYDPKIDAVRRLKFVRVHERVGKLRTREGYFSCCDFEEVGTGKMLDLDFWMDDGLAMTDVMIHKVEGKARFTYDDQDNQIMLD